MEFQNANIWVMKTEFAAMPRICVLLIVPSSKAIASATDPGRGRLCMVFGSAVARG